MRYYKARKKVKYFIQIVQWKSSEGKLRKVTSSYEAREIQIWKFSIKDFFSNCDQIRRVLWI